jgi:phage I-like protein
MADMGYLIDLNSIKLDDEANMTSWLQAFPYGKYDHPVYGEIDMSPDKAARMQKNFDDNVRGTDLDIDYDHKAHDSVAAGWIRKAEARSNGLWIMVEWTKKAWDHIKAKEYKYFSPEFHDEWKHPKTGQVFKDILFGGGITNRPFLKDILPINMSELGMPSERPQEGKGMDPKELRKLLGLPEDATDEVVNTALAERLAAKEEPKEEKKEEKTPAELEAEKRAEAIAASEGLPKEVIQLAESNPAIKALVDHVTALGTQLSATQGALRLSEVASTVKELSEGSNALPAVVQEDLTKLLSESDVKAAERFTTILKQIQGVGLVKLGETAYTGKAGEGEEDAAKKFAEEIAKVMLSDKLDYAAAAERVASLQPQLYAEYTQGAYSFREN